jgi:hypothetical protein
MESSIPRGLASKSRGIGQVHGGQGGGGRDGSCNPRARAGDEEREAGSLGHVGDDAVAADEHRQHFIMQFGVSPGSSGKGEIQPFGRQRPLRRQYLHRAPVEVLEVRVRLFACVGNRLAGEGRRRGLDDLLQSSAASSRPWRTTAHRGLLEPDSTRPAGLETSLNYSGNCPNRGEWLTGQPSGKLPILTLV